MTDDPTELSRRQFLAGASCFGAMHAFVRLIPLPSLAASMASDPRVSSTPLADAGFASVRKIGDGVYATISDPSKGFQTTCNGGFLVGKDAAFLIEGFNSPAGAAFQMRTLRMVSPAPAKGALDTHYHYDHSMGNSFYGANDVPLWAHADTAKRLVETYAPMQGAEKSAILGPYEKRVKDAKTELARTHAQSDLDAMADIFAIANANQLGLPNHPLDPAGLPMTIDLGGLSAVFESYAGHSGTDIVVRVPEQNLVFAGDLIFHGKYPVCFDAKASVTAWRETLKRFAAFDKDTIFVPGHGQLCGQEGIAVIRAVFDDIAEQAEKMYAAGIPVEEAENRYSVPAKYKTLAIWAWGFTIGSTIRILYAEWKSSPA